MKLVILISMLALFASCKDMYRDSAKFEKVLENSTGQPHRVAKLWTDVDGYVVYQNETTGEFTAYNLTDFKHRKMKTYADYLAITDGDDIITGLSESKEWVVSGHWYEESYTNTYCDSDGQNCYTETTYYQTDIWVDTSGWVYHYTGGGFTFENGNSPSKDLETMAALSEEAAVKFVGQKLSSEFSLSSSRAEELAKLSLRYRKLENNRELTVSEKNLFAMDALGVSYAQVERAMKDRAQGRDNSYEALLNEAAVYNRTSPEKIGQFFENYLGEEI